MSTEYFVIVPRGRWPNYWSLDDAFERRGFPVRIVRPARSLSGEAVVVYPQSLGLKVLLEGQPVELEAGIDALSAGSDLLTDINTDLADHKAQRRADPGDHLFSLVLRSSMEEWIAGCYLMAVLVREFGAHGFETDKGTSGDAEWADLLVKGAQCSFEYGEETDASAETAAPVATSQRALDATRKWLNIARWLAIPTIILLWGAKTWHRAEQAGLDPWAAIQEPFR